MDILDICADISDNPRDMRDISATFVRSAPVEGDRGTEVAVTVITGSFPATPSGTGNGPGTGAARQHRHAQLTPGDTGRHRSLAYLQIAPTGSTISTPPAARTPLVTSGDRR